MIRLCALALLLLPESLWSLPRSIDVGIQDSLNARSDTSEYFALYRPEDPERRKKAILFFEPLGRARLPLTLYRELADEYGLTLICPYGSRNGDFQPTLKAANAMLNELTFMGYERNQIFTSGFSGGARAASAIQKLNGLAGVIAVAGAWPPSDKYLPKNGDVFNYVGIVGDKDMNMVEHGQYQDYLTNLDIPNAIVYYPAGHQWPPKAVYQQALEWIERSALGYDQLMNFADSLLDINSYLGYLQWQQWSGYPTSNFPIGHFSDKLEDLEADQEIQQMANEHALAQKKQLELRNGYDQALEQLRTDLFKQVRSEYGIPWWKTEVRKLKKWSESQDQVTALMADRIMDGLRGAITVMLREAMEYNRFEMAGMLNQIMLLMFPDSVLYSFNQAVYLALQGQYKKAHKWLITAKEIDQDLLDQLRSNPRYRGLKAQKQYEFLF